MTALNAVHWIDAWAQFAAAAFVSSLWQGALLAVVVALGLRLMPKMSAAVRFAVWSAVFVVILLLPFAQMGGSHSAPVSSRAILNVDVRWSYVIAAVWAALSLMRGASLAISALKLRSLWRRSTPVSVVLPAVSPSALFRSRPVQICTSKEIDRPSVIGFFAPRILIPKWLFEKLTPAELKQIVMHEFGHIRRADDWINLFQKIALALSPLNPALMWIDRRLCFEREVACDDSVLRSTLAPSAYATCLVSLAEQARDRRAVSLSLGAWERQSELSRRVQSILRGGARMSPLQARLAMGTIGVALLGGAAGLSRCPHLVSFHAPDSIAEFPVPLRAPRMVGPEYRPVVFHPGNAAHETLLKATVPVREAVTPVHAPSRKKSTAGRALTGGVKHAPVVQRVKEASNGMQRWVVLTSFCVTSGIEPANAGVQPGVVLRVDAEHAIAAMPTGDGWLVIQL